MAFGILSLKNTSYWDTGVLDASNPDVAWIQFSVCWSRFYFKGTNGANTNQPDPASILGTRYCKCQASSRERSTLKFLNHIKLKTRSLLNEPGQWGILNIIKHHDNCGDLQILGFLSQWPQPRAPNLSGHCPLRSALAVEAWQCQCQRECQNRCQIDYQKECKRKCWNRYQQRSRNNAKQDVRVEYQKECQKRQRGAASIHKVHQKPRGDRNQIKAYC